MKHRVKYDQENITLTEVRPGIIVSSVMLDVCRSIVNGGRIPVCLFGIWAFSRRATNYEKRFAQMVLSLVGAENVK